MSTHFTRNSIKTNPSGLLVNLSSHLCRRTFTENLWVIRLTKVGDHYLLPSLFKEAPCALVTFFNVKLDRLYYSFCIINCIYELGESLTDSVYKRGCKR